MTALDVAELLDMHVDTVRLHSRDGVIPTHKLPGGRVFHYVRDEIIEWVRSLPHDGIGTAGH